MTRLLRACTRRSRSTGAARSRTRSWGRTTSYTYNGNGQLLTATNSAGTITVVYDRLGRQTSVDPDDGSTATTWTYTSFTSQTRVDVTGTTTATLDTFGRETSLTTPMIANPFTFTYRADGQRATQGDPSGTTTTFTYDRLGRMTDKDVTDSNCTGSVCATLDWTYNRAGQRLTEAQDTMGTPGTDGTSTFTYDKAGRITGFDSPLGGTSTHQAYGWQKVPNRDSLTIGTGTPSTLTYDAADRMTTSGYSHDADGRMTGQPGQTLVWDSLGRLKEVRNSSTNALISAYTHDALDRLRTVARASTIRFRYVGTSTGVAEVVDDGTNASQLKVGNGWAGGRYATWTGTNSNPRYLGTNGHGDVTWSADGSGAVVNTLRYDPWGNVAAASGSSLPDWRYQGSWNDTSTGIYWVVTRWYAPGLGRFISEDSLLGEPTNPLSRHLYAYAEGDPVGGWDPDGRSSVSVAFGVSQAKKNDGDCIFNPTPSGLGVTAKQRHAGWVPESHSTCSQIIRTTAFSLKIGSGTKRDVTVNITGEIHWWAIIETGAFHKMASSYFTADIVQVNGGLVSSRQSWGWARACHPDGCAGSDHMDWYGRSIKFTGVGPIVSGAKYQVRLIAEAHVEMQVSGVFNNIESHIAAGSLAAVVKWQA